MTIEAAYQGAPGAFSEDAARVVLGPDALLQPKRTLADVFASLAADEVEAAVVPVRNSLVGAVPDVARLMAEHDVRIEREHVHPIDQAIVAPPGATLADICWLWSHPVALGQCTRFLAAHIGITPRPTFDTAGAVAEVLARRDLTHAALASRRAAAVYGGVVLADKVQDRADNTTLFVLIRKGRSAGASTRLR